LAASVLVGGAARGLDESVYLADIDQRPAVAEHVRLKLFVFYRLTDFPLRNAGDLGGFFNGNWLFELIWHVVLPVENQEVQLPSVFAELENQSRTHLNMRTTRPELFRQKGT
jgi:hypothetical protein